MLDLNLIAPERPRRMSRDEYDHMVRSGVFDDERVELLRGMIIAMSPNHPPHASPVQILGMILIPRLVGRATVRVQLPLLAVDESEPEPDLAVVPLGEYREAHPACAHLVIEVADSSLRKDRLVKAPLYAASNVDEYWVVSVAERVIEVYRGPLAGAWSSITRHGAGETLHVQAFPDVAVRVDDVLG